MAEHQGNKLPLGGVEKLHSTSLESQRSFPWSRQLYVSKIKQDNRNSMGKGGGWAEADSKPPLVGFPTTPPASLAQHLPPWLQTAHLKGLGKVTTGSTPSFCPISSATGLNGS